MKEFGSGLVSIDSWKREIEHSPKVSPIPTQMEINFKPAQATQKEFEECSAQIHRMDAGLEQKENLAGELGEQVAAVAAGVIASIGTTAIVMIYLT